MKPSDKPRLLIQWRPSPSNPNEGIWEATLDGAPVIRMYHHHGMSNIFDMVNMPYTLSLAVLADGPTSDGRGFQRWAAPQPPSIPARLREIAQELDDDALERVANDD